MQSTPQPEQHPSTFSLRQRIRALPVIGPTLAWLYGIVRLNAIRRHIAFDIAELRELQQSHLLQLSERLERIDALDIGGRLNALDDMQLAQRLAQLEGADSANRLARIEQLLGAVQAANIERDNRIAALAQELRRNPRPVPVAASGMPAAVADSGFDMDSFYVEFEGKFRGTREDIQNRLKVYLPHVAALSGARVVDIGCGRGEWLELLQQQGVDAIGIDSNADMVESCRERGLQAECADAVAWLRQQPAGSLAAVTGFHIIEHLPFDTLIALFDAALHALRPDGFVIFETPNPENVSVGSCNFYYDPTHRHPLVPVVIEFMARQRGFARAEILRLHPHPESMHIAEDSEAARRINQLFYGPQDFALLAWKTN